MDIDEVLDYLHSSKYPSSIEAKKFLTVHNTKSKLTRIVLWKYEK